MTHEGEKSQPNDTCSATSSRKSPPGKNKPWDKGKAIEMAAKGYTNSQIAEVVGTHTNTVQLFLQRAAPQFQALQDYRKELGNIRTLNLAKCTSIEDKLLTLLDDEDVLSKLSKCGKGAVVGENHHCQGC